MKIPKHILVMAGVALAVIAGVIALAIATGGNQYAPARVTIADSALLVKENSRMTGERGAKVQIVEFGDYQCPACGAAHPIVKQVLEAYKNNKNFNFVFRNFPLPQHQNARAAAEAAESAGAQGHFWEMHDMLYDYQSRWGQSPDPMPMFADYARKIGMDEEAFIKNVRENKFEAVIQSDLNDGNAAGVSATPTFFINGIAQAGVPDFAAFKSAIDAELKK